MIDQLKLPRETVMVVCNTAEDVGEAIRSMQIRGAPAIGVAGAYGLALAARAHQGTDPVTFNEELRLAGESLRNTRPTAINLGWAIDRVLARITAIADLDGVAAAQQATLALAEQMADEDVAINRRMGAWGLELVPEGSRVLTHCNTGALATVDYGTALGVIRAAHEAGRRLHVLVDETRPFLQGARLTAWELTELGVPMTLITDNMAGYFMNRGEVDLIVVGADRIAANGDTANKIGTYSLAVLAKAHGVPFYVVAPTSTVDLSLQSGAEIPIEQRSTKEVVEIGGVHIAPEGVTAAHPAFDVTPAHLVTAIVTEQGILRAPYEETLRAAVQAENTPSKEAA
jgi:methylthioribose-1-phosphate isomerase